MKVLVVEDNLVQRAEMVGMLKAMFNGGTETVEVSTLKEAVTIVGTTRLDLAILDLHLDDSPPATTIAGFPFLKVPTMVFTAIDDPTLGRKSIRAGAKYYYKKPLGKADWEMFGIMAEKAMQMHAMEQSIGRVGGLVDKVAALTEIVDRALGGSHAGTEQQQR